ncbi:Uncharacterized protein APZ42_010167, partial [Daphnia magna]
QHYQKFIKASDQVRWTLQSTNATEEQIEQDYSAVAEVEEDMSAQVFAAQVLQQQQAYTQQIQQLIAQNQATAQIAAAAAPAPVAAIPAPQSTRLPQRQIKHFKGDILEWTSFWESFNAY